MRNLNSKITLFFHCDLLQREFSHSALVSFLVTRALFRINKRVLRSVEYSNSSLHGSEMRRVVFVYSCLGFQVAKFGKFFFPRILSNHTTKKNVLHLPVKDGTEINKLCNVLGLNR